MNVVFQFEKNKCFWQKICDCPSCRSSPCQVPTLLFRVGEEHDACIIWLKAGCNVGYLGILALREQVSLLSACCQVTASGCSAGCWRRGDGSRGAPCAQLCTPGAAPPQAQHGEGLQQEDGGYAAKRSPWCLLCKPDISVSQLRGLKVRKGMGHYLISFPDFLLLFWAIYTFKNA